MTWLAVRSDPRVHALVLAAGSVSVLRIKHSWVRAPIDIAILVSLSARSQGPTTETVERLIKLLLHSKIVDESSP